MSLFIFLRYMRLKILIFFFRLVVHLFTPRIPPPQPDSVLWIPSRDKGRSIKAHVYMASNGGGAHPVLLNFYGSAFIFPGHGSDDLFCRHVAMHTNHVVLDVQYRLAPEYPFPAALNDVEDAVKYVLNHPEQFSSVSVSGFSSGGTLALVLPTLFPRATFKSLIGFYPSANMATDPGQRKAPVQGPKEKQVPASWKRIFREAYIRGKDPQDPRISPFYADTSNYPNTLVLTADYDVSATQMEELADRAKVEGRNVVVRRIKGCGHAFDKDKKNLQARDEAYKLVVDMLKKVEEEGGK